MVFRGRRGVRDQDVPPLSPAYKPVARWKIEAPRRKDAKIVLPTGIFRRVTGGEHRHRAIGMVRRKYLLVLDRCPDLTMKAGSRSLGFEKPRQMKGIVMRKEVLSRRLALTPEQEAQLRALDGVPDTVDIPEAPAGNWRDAHRFHKVRASA